MNSLVLIGVALLGGTVCGKLFQRVRVPMVVGYLVIGLVIGKSGFHLFSDETFKLFTPLVNFTLGLIGFSLGAELKSDVFKKYGMSIYSILFSQGILTFALVAGAVTLLTGSLPLGLLLGAIATATDPASTTSVLWEYKARGPLTTTLTSIVALDDALALILYGLANAFAKSMLVKESFTLTHSIGEPMLEIAKSIALGCAGGWMVLQVMKRVKEKELVLAFIIGVLAVIVGVSSYFHLDLILSTMACGMLTANLRPKMSELYFNHCKFFSTALYIVFFVIVGAQLDVRIFLQMSALILVGTFFAARCVGKIYGTMFGAVVAKARTSVRKYLGYCLLPQGGVAMGLALSINHTLTLHGEEGRQMGMLIMNVAAASTFVVQLIGPPLIRYSIIKADEANRNVTREDIIAGYNVTDVMQKDVLVLKESTSLREVIKAVRDTESYYFPVVDKEERLIGSISLKELKEALVEEELIDIIVAGDMANSVYGVVAQGAPLKKAFDIFDRKGVDYLPVVDGRETMRVVGMLEFRPVMNLINVRLIHRQDGAQEETQDDAPLTTVFRPMEDDFEEEPT